MILSKFKELPSNLFWTFSLIGGATLAIPNSHNNFRDFHLNYNSITPNWLRKEYEATE